MKRFFAMLLAVGMLSGILAGCGGEAEDTQQTHAVTITIEEAIKQINETLESSGEVEVKTGEFKETTTDDGTKNCVAALNSDALGECGMVMLGADEDGLVENFFLETYNFDDENCASAILVLLGFDKEQQSTIFDQVFSLDKKDTRSMKLYGAQFHALKHTDQSGSVRSTRTIAFNPD